MVMISRAADKHDKGSRERATVIIDIGTDSPVVNFRGQLQMLKICKNFGEKFKYVASG